MSVENSGLFTLKEINRINILQDGPTQFGLAIHELNIQTIYAETNQAKGQIERVHGTLQLNTRVIR